MKMLALIATWFVTINSYAQDTRELPKEWSEDFTIEFSFSGSMDGSRTEGRITYDSCTITYQAGQKAPVKGYYRMKPQDRKAILNELQKLKATSIKTESTKVPVNDGYSQTIRIGDFWVSAGPSYEMSSDDRQRFGEVYRYLEGYTLRKANPR